MPHRLIILGATGDRTARYLAPALAAGRVPLDDYPAGSAGPAR